MSDRPPFGVFVIAILGAGALIFARRISNVTNAELLTVVGFILLAYVAAVLGSWMVDRGTDVFDRIVTASDRKTPLAEAITRMDREQRQTWLQTIHVGVDVSADGKKYMRGTNAPISFVELFLKESNDEYLCPVSKWSEGTKERTWAQEITDELCGPSEYATAARGPFSARWSDTRNRRGIAAAMNIRLATPSPSDPGFHPYNRN